MTHSTWTEIDSWIDYMIDCYGGIAYDVDGRRWDWGQALCRALYGPSWSDHPEFLAVQLADIPHEPVPIDRDARALFEAERRRDEDLRKEQENYEDKQRQEQENYNDSLKDLDDNLNKRIARMEEDAEIRRQKLREDYEKDRAELEEQLEEELEAIELIRQWLLGAWPDSFKEEDQNEAP